MGRYVYITENNLENRQRYQFSEFGGQAFLDSYFASRQMEGPADVQERRRTECLENGEAVQTAQVLPAENEAEGGRHIRTESGMICEEHADRILKSFEVRKRIYSAYSENCTPVDPDDYADPAPYLDFAELMLHMYSKTDHLKYLNALLKVDDTLLSMEQQLTKEQKNRLCVVLGRETAYVRELDGKNGRKADTYKNEEAEKQQECVGSNAGGHRLRNTAMICVDSARTKAYLQVLCRGGIYVNHCYIMCEHKEVMEEELRKYAELQESAELPGSSKYFNADEPVLYTLHKYDISFTFIPTGDINSLSVLDILSKAPEAYMIYSGFGGQILKPELFQIGKQYMHAHAGMVPAFRGSTTIYYHMLETGNAAVSVMFLNEKLDEGDILARYTYGIPADADVDIDMVYEPYIRALALRSVLGRYIENGEFQRTKQPKEGNTYYIIHPVLKHMAVMNLRV